MSALTLLLCGAALSLIGPSEAWQPRTLWKRAVISSSYTDSGLNTQFGTVNQLTTINPGVLVWINGGATHNIFGNLDNSGGLFISQTAFLATVPLAGGQTVDWVGHDANNGILTNRNGAVIQLNDIGSNSAPTYDWYIRQMSNNGTLQFCGRGDTGGSTYQLYNDLESTNNGLISFEQAFGRLGVAYVWRNPVLSTTGGPYLYNNGNFRIINVVYHNVMNMYGSGCWQIGVGGVLYLEDGTGVFQNPTSGPSFPGQSILFSDSSAVLHMDTQVYARNSAFGATIYGFGAGNAIEFFELISTQSYSASTGILTVRMLSGNSVNIKMGLGYTASSFYVASNPQFYNVAGYNAVFYRGAAPSQSAPSVCSISAPVCANLATSPPSLPSTTPLSSTTTYGGSVTATRTVATTINGSPTSVVVVNEPAFSSTTTYGGSITATNTVATTINGSPTSVVVVNQPALSTTTTYGGSITATNTVATTINGSPTSVVVVNQPALSTTTTYGGSITATATVAITINGSPTSVVVVNQPALSSTTIYSGTQTQTNTVATNINGSPTSIVIVNEPALSSTTIYSGSQTLTSTVATNINGSPTSIVVVNDPALSSTTTYGGSISQTRTIATTNSVGSPTSIVIVHEPALSTTTTTGGSQGYTSTIATIGAGGAPTSVVVVDQPALSTVTTMGGSQGYTSTILTTGAGGAPSSVVVVNQPALSTITTTTGASSFTSTVLTTGTNGSPSSIVVIGQPSPTGTGCSATPSYAQAISPSRQSTLVCGTYGSLSRPLPQQSFTSVADSASCARLCATSKLSTGRYTCFAFSYNPTSGDCVTYSTAPVFMGYATNSSSPLQIYNINCFGTLAETATIPAGCGNNPYYQNLQPLSATLVCGTPGTLSRPLPQNTFSGVADVATCAQSCARSKLDVGSFTCFSFSYSASSKTCQTYYVAPYFMGYAANASSPNAFYNINCFTTR